MDKILPPIFARLYISMIIALCASIFLTLQFSYSYLERNSIADFARDTSYTYQIISEIWEAQGITASAYFDDSKSPKPYYHFDVKLLSKLDDSAPCADCNYLSSIKNVAIYENEEGEFYSVHPLRNTSDVLVISDRRSLEIALNKDAWYTDPEELLPLVIFAVALLVIGSMLYYPTRQLQVQIERLVRSHHDFGHGALETRADEDIPKPLSELAINFNIMAKRIDNKVSESLVFAQAVPHEMRTPLSRIQLASGLLRKNCNETGQQELLDNIDTYIDDLDDLAAQVVTYSRLNSVHNTAENGQVQHVMLNDFITTRLSLFQPSSSIDVRFDIEQQSMLECDPVHLRLIIDNLVKNALQYTRSRILISARIEGRKQILSVEDDGAGIAVEKRPLVFVPFARLDKSRNNKTGGLGLGLSIANAAANKLGGTLSVTEGQYGGAKFVLTLGS